MFEWQWNTSAGAGFTCRCSTDGDLAADLLTILGKPLQIREPATVLLHSLRQVEKTCIPSRRKEADNLSHAFSGLSAAFR